jgi:hypothetical protein
MPWLFAFASSLLVVTDVQVLFKPSNARTPGPPHRSPPHRPIGPSPMRLREPRFRQIDAYDRQRLPGGMISSIIWNK